MPRIIFGDQEITCNEGDNLRQVLLENNLPLYNGNAKIINCHGIGSCGTCAVEIEGEVLGKNWKEKARLSLPPHSSDSPKRLACQVSVTGDMTIKKCSGFWGQGDRPVV